MTLIDSNSLVVLLLGTIDPRLINRHKRTSIYEEQDYYELLARIKDFKELVTLPNIWTEVDNLLNNFTGHQKEMYIKSLKKLIQFTSEVYIKTRSITNQDHIYDLGITDSLILMHAKECKLLITSDSKLSDYAEANGINVFDMVKNRNMRL